MALASRMGSRSNRSRQLHSCNRISKNHASRRTGFFINSGILHSCWDPDASGCIFHSIVFHPRLISGSTDSAIHLNYILPMMDNSALDLMILSPSLPWQQEALNAIEIAWQACRQAKSGYEFVVRNALSSLILILWDHLPPDQSVSEKRTQRETN